VFENKVSRRTFATKRDEATREWRKFYSGELHNFYSFRNIIRQIRSRRMKWAGHVACMGKERKGCRVFVGELEGKTPLGRPRSKWEYGFKMDLQEIGWEGVEWTGSGLL
jgi:hypothetical protein